MLDTTINDEIIVTEEIIDFWTQNFSSDNNFKFLRIIPVVNVGCCGDDYSKRHPIDYLRVKNEILNLNDEELKKFKEKIKTKHLIINLYGKSIKI
jgi:hypothetical protein